jgi:hypothetical protein
MEVDHGLSISLESRHLSVLNKVGTWRGIAITATSHKTKAPSVYALKSMMVVLFGSMLERLIGRTINC